MAVHSLSDDRTGRQLTRTTSTVLYQPDEVPTPAEIRSALKNALFLIALMVFVACFITLRGLIYAKVL